MKKLNRLSHTVTFPQTNIETENGRPKRKFTQEDQDDADEEKKRQAMRDLCESWMDRLQLISVVTTFFASTEAGLLQISTPDSPGDDINKAEEAANAALLGALVLHVCAAIISFLAAFFLVRYKLEVAKTEEKKAEEHTANIDIPRADASPKEEGLPKLVPVQSTDPRPGPVKISTGFSEPPIWSSNPHIVQVGPFHGQPPTHLLGRCHSLCVFLAAVGFVLALTGILCFAWARHARTASVFASVCMGFTVITSTMILVVPDLPNFSRIKNMI